MVIALHTRDRLIWNVNELIIDMCKAMSINDNITLDLNGEGCDCQDIGLYDIIDNCARKFDYDISKISIRTWNTLEQHPVINIKSSLSWHLLQREIENHKDLPKSKNSNLKHFGRFVGRSNAPRLMLSTYLDEKYCNNTLSTYHYNSLDDYHKDHTGLESLINDFQVSDIGSHARFLSTCPRTIHHSDFVWTNDSQNDYYEQLLKTDHQQFKDLYLTFFVEIVSESYYNGNTFFITEKTCRPILCKTPFVIQGPTGFLKNLRALGFRTFDRWWDEGYDEDPPSWSVREIMKVIDFLATKTQQEMSDMLQDMQDVLDYNRNHMIEMVHNERSK
jgi:hypothetical protein